MDDFSNALAELLALKPPGVSGSRIRRIVEDVVLHPESESVVVEELYSHIKKTPVTHKLGALYVLDAVARAYQTESYKDSHGTAAVNQYKLGLKGLEDQLSSAFDNLLVSRQSQDTFDKMRKVIDIWVKADTFDKQLLEDLRQKHFSKFVTTTPPGSPPATWAGLPKELLAPPPMVETAPAAPKANAASILEKLAALAKTKDEARSATPELVPAAPAPAPAAPPSLDMAALMGSTGDAGSGGSLLEKLMAQTGSAIPPNLGQHGQHEPPAASSLYANDRSRGRDHGRDPRLAFERNRSRSPESHASGRPAQRGSPQLGSGTQAQTGPSRPRNVSFDPSLVPINSIRVFSRTLFVGSIPPQMDERGLRQALEEFAPLQSMIFHKEKRHAFAKVYSRAEAEAIMDGLDKRYRTGAPTPRARWGVGFGPRDCCDYPRGVSVIEIGRLTDADRRWVHSTGYGGAGREIEPGQVMEEPDIEIGAGVSSKSISQRKFPAPAPSRSYHPPSQDPRQQAGASRPSNAPSISDPGVPGIPGMPAGMPAGMPMMGMMPGMGGMPGMPGMPGIPGMPGMPGATAGQGDNGQGMPMMPFPMMPMMPPGADMQAFFANMQQPKKD